MKTELLYLSDSYLNEEKANLIETGVDDKGSFLILDKTIFYPQGGGQPSDVGVIKIWGRDIEITDVRMVDGLVRHYMCGEKEDSVPSNDEAICVINWEKRYRNTRCHTSGHLVAHAIEYSFEDMKAIKGYHFEDGPYVEFISDRAVDTIDVSLVEEIMDGWINKNLTVKLSYIQDECFDEIEKISENKPCVYGRRFVGIGDIKPIQCGGTHVKSLAELNKVKISKIKRKTNNIRVGYSWE